uniref:hypothetical protein n=1 Tax=uncultured Sphingomonas sp. TaxID=158754 RepID=UPI0025ED8732|nr:hypothetical protein [uncultured Sphingomonas sp.]
MEQTFRKRVVSNREKLSSGPSGMISTQDYRRRMASLARAEAGRSPTRVVQGFSAIALARRCASRPDRPGAVDPVAASRPDAVPLLLRA